MFTTNYRPVKGTNGYYRSKMQYGYVHSLLKQDMD
ncbi:hypothetical protein [Oceanobacillus sp. FSL W7-1309]